MSLIHIGYFSQAIQKQTGMYVVLPGGDGPFGAIYLLHGLSDDYTIWQRRTSVERYADRHGVLVAMLDGGRSFYCDAVSGAANYEQHILEAVRFVDRTFRTIAKPGARGIGGLSMGGYGAMKLGLKYPGIFGSVTSHSGALDMAASVRTEPWPELPLIYGKRCAPTEDCFVLAARRGAKPAIHFDCGAGDFLLEHNRRFHARLDRLKVPHRYQEFPGEHNWEYWDEHLDAALRFHVDHFKPRRRKPA
jgi:S-formylglutathione hydrolase FrmB